ncbi:MAG TPA: CYTH domain-containing protein [Roseiflexaceae bacterium]|nr:CYTH domain-containing protein [Roseiflexaceae bacterium]HMP40628.1 CYTH domain-containing protein [Roseiflexaceae bacterium]
MEVEAKYAIDDAGWQLVPTLRTVGAFTLVAAPMPEQQQNIYFDTPAYALRAAGYGLRLRMIGDRRIATLKGPAHIRNGIHERSEWEIDVATDQPASWPAGDLRNRALALAQGGELRPILTITTQRRHLYAWHAQRQIAEISLDDACISVAGHEERFRELEAELLPDAPRELFDAFVHALGEVLTLTPQSISKLARGFVLLDQMRPAAQR